MFHEISHVFSQGCQSYALQNDVSRIRVGNHQVPIMTKGQCDPIAFSCQLARQYCEDSGSLWPVTELGLLGLCYSSDLQVQYLT